MLPAYILAALIFTSEGYYYRYRNAKTSRVAMRRTISTPSSDYNGIDRVYYPKPENATFDNTFFCPLPAMAQRNSVLLDETKYPWLGRLVAAHYKNELMAPLMCTLAAVRVKVFVTAARCIASAKAEFTTILYQNRKIGVRVFITSMEPTKQLFDDTGLIVSWAPWYNKTLTYHNVTLPVLEREENTPYDFFEQLAGRDYSVIGFVASEDSPETHNLYMLTDMYASNSVCNKIYPMMNDSNDYWAPCIHSCSVGQHLINSDHCRRYQFGLGHAVLDLNKHLMGIVTWSCENSKENRAMRGDLPMPIGIAVPNKKTLEIDLNCAIEITHDNSRYDRDHHLHQRGYYREVCVNYYNIWR